MSIRLYFDEHVNGALARALRRHNVDVLTVQQDGLEGEPDPVIFERATELGRVLVSFDRDMVAIADEHVTLELDFAGLLFLRRATIGQHVDNLEYLATLEPMEFFNKILFLPL